MTKQSVEPVSHNKPCTLCQTPRPVLVRCQIDETGKWHMVCPGKCWKSVSGGEIDAKGHKDEFPYYRYGGMWKNKHEDGPITAKKPKKGGKLKSKDDSIPNGSETLEGSEPQDRSAEVNDDTKQEEAERESVSLHHE